MKVGIAIDDWKLKTFSRHLDKGGFKATPHGQLSPGVLFLTVETDDPESLEQVIHAANTECASQ